MKKLTMITLILVLILSSAACGNQSGPTPGVKNTQPQQIKNYHDFLTDKESVYYYEGTVKEKAAGSKPVKSGIAGAGNGAGKYVILSGPSTKKLIKRALFDGTNQHYVMNRETKTYYREDNDPADQDFNNLTYSKSSVMKINGKSYQYDEFEKQWSIPVFEEGVSGGQSIEYWLNIERYITDGKGNLYGIQRLQKNLGANRSAKGKIQWQRMVTITKFQVGTTPKGIFDIPTDYKKTEAGSGLSGE